MRITLRTLTVRQPWAYAIVRGFKTVENRSRPTNHRGPLLIHAGLSRASIDEGLEFFEEIGLKAPRPEQLALGAIIGVVNVVDCVPIKQRKGDPWASGPWCWIVSQAHAIEPIACKGSLGMFKSKVDSETIAKGRRSVTLGELVKRMEGDRPGR